ncbi:MAG: IS3 family transposase [Coprococcus sp.]
MDQLCRLLEISRSGYYAWLHRGISPRKQQDQRLSRQLITLHQQQPASGLDTLFHMIRRKMVCSRKRIYRLMRQLHIQSARKFAYKRTTNSRHSHPVAPNLLNRNFQVSKPNTVWVGDITYIPTGQGWLYLAIVKDLCTKKVVGYAFSNRIDMSADPGAALRMAVEREHPALLWPMASAGSGRAVCGSGVTGKSSKTGLCAEYVPKRRGPHDNAVAENFFSCLKCELSTYLTSYATRRQAQNSNFSIH